MADFDFGGEDIGGASFPSGLNLGGESGSAFPSGLTLGGSDLSFSLPELGPTTAPGSSLLDTAKGIIGSRGQAAPQPGQRGPGTGLIGGVESGLGGFAEFARGIMPVAQLGLAGLGVKGQLDAAGQARQQGKLQREMQQMQRESVQPLQQFGRQQLGQAQAGHLDPAVEQQLASLVEAQKMQARQWFASQGITDSTMMESVLREIDQKAMAMRAQVLGMDKDQAIRALQASMQGAGQGAQIANQEQNQLDMLIKESNRALAALTGSIQ